MKYIVSGSRRITNCKFVAECIEKAIEHFTCEPLLVIEGGQRTIKDEKTVGGVDYLARVWAFNNKIPFKTESAKWGKYGFAAGPIRNRKMAEMSDVLVAIPDAASKGTRDMVQAMRELDKPVYVIEF